MVNLILSRSMGKTEKRKETLVNVVFDTSLIFGKQGVIQNEIGELIKETKNWENLQVKWYISDTVSQEGMNHYFAYINGIIKAYGSNAGNVEKWLGVETARVDKREDKDLEEDFKKMVANYNLKYLKTEWKKIDVKEMMFGACWKRGPFVSGVEGKGFRDYLIVENLRQNIENLSGKKGSKIIFVTDDEDQESWAKEILQGVSFNGNISELRKLLQTMREQKEEKDILEIREHAEKFFVEEIFPREEIRKKILEGFEKRFENPKRSLMDAYTSMSPLVANKKLLLRKESKFYNLGTNYLRKYRGSTFSWESNLRVQRFYDEKTEKSAFAVTLEGISNVSQVLQQTLGGVEGNLIPIEGQLDEDLSQQYGYDRVKLSTKSPIVEDETSPKTYDFGFVVKWNVKVDNKGNFSDEKVLDISFDRQYSPWPFILG